jgi:hypothetical protein
MVFARVGYLSSLCLSDGELEWPENRSGNDLPFICINIHWLFNPRCQLIPSQ